MNIAIDIGNTRIKCGIFHPDGKIKVCFLPIPPKGNQFDQLTAACSAPITWRIAQTGSFTWQELKVKILKVRPQDKFKIVTRKHLPLSLDVDVPQKVGIDRLLAAFAATGKYGESPMLVVDAGSAITIDVVQNRTFCGGAILPGLAAQSENYPKISKNLPLVPVSDSLLNSQPVYPGRNTKDAICNGFYWGTIGAIRQFCTMFFAKEKNIRLILTGGDAEYLLPGLVRVIPFRQITHCDTLVLEGINGCFGG